MRQRRQRTLQECLDYHIKDGRAIVFEGTVQGERIKKARELVIEAISDTPKKARIIELGCGAADISGPFSLWHVVSGFDVVPAVAPVIKQRFPWMSVTIKPIEEVRVQRCDCLVLCEILEHLHDPLDVVREWLPFAKSVVIGHPLNEGDDWGEDGHSWSYTLEDFKNWFEVGGHELVKHEVFPMSCYAEMVIGLGRNKT